VDMLGDGEVTAVTPTSSSTRTLNDNDEDNGVSEAHCESRL